jgi:hypothetical protein
MPGGVGGAAGVSRPPYPDRTRRSRASDATPTHQAVGDGDGAGVAVDVQVGDGFGGAFAGLAEGRGPVAAVEAVAALGDEDDGAGQGATRQRAGGNRHTRRGTRGGRPGCPDRA